MYNSVEQRAADKQARERIREDREQEQQEQLQRQQLIADIKEISAQIYAVLQSWDWSRAELWTLTIKPRTWWRWRAVTEERAVLHFMTPPVSYATYWMASDSTLLIRRQACDAISLQNYYIRESIGDIADNGSLARIKTRLEAFVRNPTPP